MITHILSPYDLVDDVVLRNLQPTRKVRHEDVKLLCSMLKKRGDTSRYQIVLEVESLPKEYTARMSKNHCHLDFHVTALRLPNQEAAVPERISVDSLLCDMKNGA